MFLVSCGFPRDIFGLIENYDYYFSGCIDQILFEYTSNIDYADVSKSGVIITASHDLQLRIWKLNSEKDRSVYNYCINLLARWKNCNLN